MDLFCQTCVKNSHNFYYMGYIDPGTGYVFSSIVPVILGFLATFAVTIMAFFTKRKNLIVLIIIIALIATMILMFNKKTNSNKVKSRTVVLGIDGMDPNILSQAIDKNLMPNFKKLKETGYYSELQTTIPPQSPVAWASFATGTDPSEHGIYDFIVRDPKNYQLDLVWMENIKSAIRGETFWQKAGKNNINTTVLFLPNTFPPSSLYGRMISGMGTPDILGTAGKFSLFTTKELNENSRGNQVSLDNTETQMANIPGPRYQAFNEKKATSIPLKIEKNNEKKQLALTIQGQKIILKEGKFSDWIKLEFKIDFFTKINGIAKFYLKQLSPDLEIYLSPINFDPSKPIKDISYPKTYSKDLVKEYGLFYTQGLPHDTWALEEEVFNDRAFLENAELILKERENIYFGELAKQKNGLFFSYFGITDTISHMYWKDPEVIFKFYKKIDDIVGKTLSKLNKEDTLIILSDHGFAGLDWGFNLNSWLRDNGYLVLKGGAETGGTLLDQVDWEKTKAYAIGYNGVYLNLKGREERGIVEKKDSQALEEKLKKDLLQIINPNNDLKVIKNVYTKEELKIKSDDANSPDLFIGYYKGIRSSWDTAVGATPKNIFNKRVDKWSGDHLFDASEVPGVLLSNKDLKLKNPQITQIMPLVLKLFK